MKKYSLLALITLLLVSIIINVNLLVKQQSRSQALKPEIKGQYELVLSFMRGVQSALEEYSKAEDESKKTLAMYQLIRSSDAASYESRELNRKLYEAYGETLGQLPETIFDISWNSLISAVESDEQKRSSQLKSLKARVDSLLHVLNPAKITDEQSLKQTKAEFNKFLHGS